MHVGEANNEATRASRVFFPLGWSLCREVGVFCGRSELPVAPPRFPRPSDNGSPTSMLRFDTGQDRRKPSSRTPKHPSPAFETLAAATFSKSGCIERCRFFRLNRALRPSSTFRVVSSRYGSFAAAHAHRGRPGQITKRQINTLVFLIEEQEKGKEKGPSQAVRVPRLARDGPRRNGYEQTHLREVSTAKTSCWLRRVKDATGNIITGGSRGEARRTAGEAQPQGNRRLDVAWFGAGCVTPR